MNVIEASVNGIISRGVKAASINSVGRLLFTLTDGSVIDLGKVKGDTGISQRMLIRGQVESISELPLIGEDGECWSVADGDEYSIYIWSDGDGRWLNLGGIIGEQGPQGVPGAAGTGIAEIAVEENDVSGGENIITIKLTNGSSKMFSVRNGDKGETAAWIDIKGTLNSVSELPTVGNTGGDGYVVGAEKNIYIYSASLGGFTNLGTIRGADGHDGATGPQGEPGVPGRDAVNIASTVTLAADGWDADGKTQSVSVDGLTESDNVIVTPAADSYVIYGECQLRCTAQGDGTLTFTYTDKPAEDVGVNILVMR